MDALTLALNKLEERSPIEFMDQVNPLPEQIRVFEKINPRTAFYFIIGFSLAALLFLVWLIYINEGAADAPQWVRSMPAWNAGFNTLSTVFLLLGFREIKKRNFSRHMKFMISAFVTSALFLVSYVVYHHFVGDTKFMGEGFIRPVYFFVLITHIALSVFVVPLVLSSFYLAFAGKFEKHRRVSKWTFPVWLYVSVTGVLVFFMLKYLG